MPFDLDGNGKPDEIKQELVNYPNPTSPDPLHVEGRKLFYIGADGGVVFRTPMSASATTPNSSNLRTELRERTADGSKDIYWTTAGTHSMTIDQKITRVPDGAPNVVVGQIHGDKSAGIDDALVLRFEKRSGTSDAGSGELFLSFNGGKLRGPITVDSNYVIGTRFTYTVEVADGKHRVWYNGTPVKDGLSDVVFDKAYNQAYFRAGMYAQSRCPREESNGAVCSDANYAEAIIYSLSVSHNGATTVVTPPVAVFTSTPAPTLSPTPPIPTTIICDLCGYCSAFPNQIPDDYAQCVTCLYGAVGDPNNPENQLNTPSLDGFHWTVAGCVETSVGGFTQQATQWLTGIAGGSLFLVMLYGGLVILIARGDSEKIARGRTLLGSAALALLIIIFATFILQQAGDTFLKLPGF
jgi:hypothetical protein